MALNGNVMNDIAEVIYDNIAQICSYALIKILKQNLNNYLYKLVYFCI